jgi:hypothetical protein
MAVAFEVNFADIAIDFIVGINSVTELVRYHSNYLDIGFALATIAAEFVVIAAEEQVAFQTITIATSA